MENVEMTVRQIPVLNIPDIGVNDQGWSLGFKIPTSSGTVDVEGMSRAWCCSGSVEALKKAGLIEIEWIPGEHQNNKTSQTVVFGVGGPSLYRGNPKGKNIGQCIRIRKLSKNRFSVEIPATPEQVQLLEMARKRALDRHTEQMDQRHLDEAIKTMISTATERTPMEKKENFKLQLRMLIGSLELETVKSGFNIDAASDRAIGQHLAALLQLFDEAVITRVPVKYEGNVVSIGRG